MKTRNLRLKQHRRYNRRYKRLVGAEHYRVLPAYHRLLAAKINRYFRRQRP